MLRHKAFTPWYLVRYWRLLVLRLRHPHVVTQGHGVPRPSGRAARPARLRSAGARPLGAPRRRQRAACARGHADRRRQVRAGSRQHRQLLPGRRDRRRDARRRLGVRLRLRPRDRRRARADQGPGHREVAGADRCRARWIGVKASVLRGTTLGRRLRRRRARRRSRRLPGRVDRRGHPGSGRARPAGGLRGRRGPAGGAGGHGAQAPRGGRRASHPVGSRPQVRRLRCLPSPAGSSTGRSTSRRVWPGLGRVSMP